ncbi:MAG: hypothetical protein IRZ31_20360 [Thermogemmatispora sp.]|uniref:hypothetical protein n=1 Tax=Thermogemmatispora sp. TaxID=1968838 RepID=UPI002631A791|nr:hypothetical protein [Thermogemmatispora sp.]MBX5459253.1 hypothetical protein [Thermogemmatispora sp.]
MNQPPESSSQMAQDQAQAQPSRPSPPAARLGQDGNIEFERLSTDELQSVPAVAQALDNQWLPCRLLQPVFQAGGVTSKHDRILRNYVRSEYVRLLIQSEQIILNRAYLYNSAAVTQDYVGRRNPTRPIFQELLEKATIVPFLLHERSPADPPQSSPGGQGEAYGVTTAFQQWREVCQEVRPRCLRLSWDDQENERRARRALVHPFASFAKSITQHDLDLWLQDLALPASAREPFRQRLIEVERFCLDLTAAGKDVTRDALYREFVVAGPNTAERRYDGSKPFAAELKQLFDLCYNANLPNALGSYLLTPADSLPRVSLQELVALQRLASMSGEEIVQLLKRLAFELVQQGLNLPSLHLLSLRDVAEIRRMDEWHHYMQQLRDLLAHPQTFADGGTAHVYESYMRLTRRIVQMLQERRQRIPLRVWTPVVMIVFNIAGALLEVTLTNNGPIYTLAGQVAASLAGEAASVVATLVIRDAAQRRSQQDLSMSVDFMRCRLRAAQEQWREIQRMVRALPGFQESQVPPARPDETDSNLSGSESDAHSG